MNPTPQQTTAKRHQRIGIVWLLSALLTLVAAYAGYRLYLAHKIKVKIGQIRQAGFPVTTAELNKWYAAVPPEERLATGYVVYSIESDRVDDGGKEKEPGDKSDSGYDLTFTVDH